MKAVPNGPYEKSIQERQHMHEQDSEQRPWLKREGRKGFLVNSRELTVYGQLTMSLCAREPPVKALTAAKPFNRLTCSLVDFY
jgi:hypothetical protein